MQTISIAMDAGWRLETPNNQSEYSTEPFCYLTLHGQKYGRIRSKDCLFEEVAEGVPTKVKNEAIEQMAMNRERVEDVFRYNRENSHLFGGGTAS